MARVKKGRIHLLDEIRGAAILCMVLFHAFYSMAFFFHWEIGATLYDFFLPVSLWFAGLFILISGISCRLSHSNAARGGKLLAIALGLTLVTWLLEHKVGIVATTIWFGILHLLSVCMLIYAALRRPLEKISPWIAVPLFALLFAVTYHLPDGYLRFVSYTVALPDWLTNCRFLFPLGVVYPGFASADYYPLFPWIFLFLIGASVGRRFSEGKLPACFYNEHVRPIAYCGRHTLVIYLAHQPILYGLFWVISLLMEKLH